MYDPHKLAILTVKCFNVSFFRFKDLDFLFSFETKITGHYISPETTLF